MLWRLALVMQPAHALHRGNTAWCEMARSRLSPTTGTGRDCKSAEAPESCLLLENRNERLQPKTVGGPRRPCGDGAAAMDALLLCPVLDLQALDAPEILCVVGDDSQMVGS